MPKFKYKAVNSSGRSVEDELDAESRQDMMLKLNALSLTPLEVSEAESTAHASPALGRLFSNGRISGKNITQFTSQLSALINAKMNLAKALQALERQNEGAGKISTIISALLADVNKGKPLSDALEAYPQYFSDMYVNMVRVGETGGVLDSSLQRLVEMRLKDEDLSGKIKGALAYPAVMALVMIASLIVMLTFVIPKFSGIFTQMGTSLPFSTKVVLATSNFLESWWWLVIIAAACATAGGIWLLRKNEYMEKFDKLKLSVPVIGNILREMSISRYSLSMGALLTNGVSMMKALEAAVPVTGNLFIENALRQISSEVREGSSFSAALRKKGEIFPILMTGMVGTGEESGSLDEMLNNVGEYFRKESEKKINTLTTLFEPVMIIVMGGIVGFIISAILLPIFNVSTSIH